MLEVKMARYCRSSLLLLFMDLDEVDVNKNKNAKKNERRPKSLILAAPTQGIRIRVILPALGFSHIIMTLRKFCIGNSMISSDIWH